MQSKTTAKMSVLIWQLLTSQIKTVGRYIGAELVLLLTIRGVKFDEQGFRTDRWMKKLYL